MAGGVAVVRVSGQTAYEVAARIFRPADTTKKIENAKGYTAMYGHFVHNGQCLDEVIALCFRGPKSYTGEDVVELQCHGGEAVSSALLRACFENGAQPAQAGEFTKRAFLSGRISLTEAEAVMDIINAGSRKSLLAASSAMQGALYNEIQKARNALLGLAGHISAYVDYPEEDVEELKQDVLINVLLQENNRLQALISSYDKAAVLKRGIKTAIVGSPNVGKSTFLNLLSGFERAIVTPIAGTTRDVVEQEVFLGGVRLILADTAGIRKTEDQIEAEGIRRTYNQMENADLIIAVFDASADETQNDIELAKKCSGKRALCVLNKTDLEQRFNINEISSFFSTVITISAKQRQFIDVVEEAIEQLCSVDIDTDAPMIANERQLFEAKKAQEAVSEALLAAQQNVPLDAVGVCIDDAMNSLYSLTGENATADIIDEVFSKFCVGK